MSKGMNERDKEKIKDNLRAYLHHFQPITIEKEDYGKGYYVYQNGDSTNSSYIQFCENIDYLNGWLYGAVQARCSVIKLKDKEVFKVGIIIPNFCDQRYLRDRDKNIEAYSESEAIEQFKEYAFKYYFNPDEITAVKRGQIGIGIIKE